MARWLGETRGGDSPVNQLENKSSHHERLLRLTRTTGNAANWPVASRRSFWSRAPRAPRVSSATPAGISELVIPVHAEFQTELILFFTSLSAHLWRIPRMHSVAKLSARGRSDRYLPRCGEGGGCDGAVGTRFISHQQRQMRRTKVTLHSLHTGVTL